MINRPPESTPAKIRAFKRRPCVRCSWEAGFISPTSQDVADLIHLAGWSQRQVAMLTGVTYDPKKGSATVRRWKAAEDAPQHREIPISAWRLLLLYSGITDPIEDLTRLSKPVHGFAKVN